MRHPNICLYIGACLDPPNRAIITELAANGSLWDALRLPLTPPYIACDGLTRQAWPMTLYQPGKHGTPPSSFGTAVPPIPSKGSWPWILVKRVARGAACGMAYLHNGNPPILHRDLKSANILLDEAYQPKVGRFMETSFVMGAEQDSRSADSFSLFYILRSVTLDCLA